MFGFNKAEKQIEVARELCEYLGNRLGSPISVRLWDDTAIPLGPNAEGGPEIIIRSPGVFGTLIRRPTADNLLRLYALEHIDYAGTDLLSLIETARVRDSRKRVRGVPKKLLAKVAMAFGFASAGDLSVSHSYAGDETGFKREQAENKNFIQFHYDVSNDFYKLFLDPEMVYSCAYFHDWDQSLEDAQLNKLDMICRKLRLQPGERFLDIGCGWGALVCHAAKNYGVTAHGITLSEEQLELAREKVDRLGLSKQVTLALCDYADVEGPFDKAASIGMVEHVGVKNMAAYMRKVRSVLSPRGVFLNHGITRPGKLSDKAFHKMRPERKLIAKYIFPGGELDHIGHMLQCTEATGWEVHDVEGWRDHYGLTCAHWSRRLEANKEQAVQMIGSEKYRMWQLYLTGVSLALTGGTLNIFQTVATKRTNKGRSGMPPTREHLYTPDTRHTQRRAA